MAGKSGFEFLDMLCEDGWAPLTKGVEIRELPAKRRQIGNVRNSKERPVRLTARQAKKELSLGGRQVRRQFLSQPLAGFQQGVQAARYLGHADEAAVVVPCDVLVAAKQHFMDGSIVASEIYDEAFDHALGQPTGLIKLPDIEQITRVLAIEGRNEFAAIEFIGREHGQLQFRCELLGRSRTQRAPFDGQDATAKDGVDFDLDLVGFVFDDELGIAEILATDEARAQSLRSQPLFDGSQFPLNGRERFVAQRLPRHIDDIDVDG
ncbi:hypothetical protein WI77_10870 [Burkholderia ubonensis]|nr:hypothetical protein WI77_10870 [Burkholderia ubonensis]